MEKLVEKYLTDKYSGCTYTIYPFISDVCKNKELSYGCIETSVDKWNQITLKLSKSRYTIIREKIYVYRDLEYHTYNSDNINNIVIHKKIKNVKIDDRCLLIISDDDILDSDHFPKLNSYHDEYEKITKSYKFGLLCMNLITIKNSREYHYIELIFQYKTNMSNTILKDLKYITNNVLNE